MPAYDIPGQSCVLSPLTRPVFFALSELARAKDLRACCSLMGPGFDVDTGAGIPDGQDTGRGREYYAVNGPDGSMTGLAGFEDLDLPRGRAVLAYFFSPAELRAKAHGEPFRLLARRAFVSYGLKRLTCAVMAGDAATPTILLSLGFKKEGVLREYFFSDGEPVDMEVYGLLRKEWHS